VEFNVFSFFVFFARFFVSWISIVFVGLGRGWAGLMYEYGEDCGVARNLLRGTCSIRDGQTVGRAAVSSRLFVGADRA
jgi:hypothetical protein